MSTRLVNAETGPSNGNGCDEGVRPPPEPCDNPGSGCGGDGFIGLAPDTGADAERRRRKNSDLLSAADAHDPTGRTAQRARARPALYARVRRDFRYADHGAAGGRPRLENLLGGTAGGGPRCLRPV